MQEKISEVVLILIASTLIIVILSILIIVAVIISQRRKFRHRRELIELKANYEKEVLNIQLETQTQTLETISRELHDNVGTLVSMALVHLKSRPVNNLSQNSFEEATRLLDEVMTDLRDISRSINPENIQRRGLAQSIQNELDRLKRTRVFVTEFKTDGKIFPIDPQTQVILFRIVQESLNNAIKHSQGTELAVAMTFDRPLLIISIRDNGKGFMHNPQNGDYLNHSGLRNMRKRAALIKARLSVESEKNVGTLVRISTPVSCDGSENTIKMVDETF